MNLAKKYKQLFEGKIRSNDSILLMERNYGPMDKWNNDLQGVYDQMSGIDKDFQSTISLSAFSKTSDTTGLNPENAYDHAVKWLDKGKELSPEELAKVRTDNAAYGEAYDAYFKAVQEKDPKQKNAGIVLFMLAFVYRFKKDKEMGAVLLAVAGGNFSEGIDLPGDLLKSVIVVGLPLSRPDLETTELINYYDQKYSYGRIS